MMDVAIQVIDLYSSGQEIRLIKVNVKHKERFPQRSNFYLFGCSYSYKSSSRVTYTCHWCHFWYRKI